MQYLVKKPTSFISSINDEIGSLLHRSFDNIFPEYIFNEDSTALAMPVDVKEYEEKYDIKVELPGVKKDNVDIELNKSFIKINAKKEEEREEKNKKFHKSEFRYGEYSRTIYFPEEVDCENAKSKLKNGILTIDLPKKKSENKETKKLSINEE